MTLKRRVFHGTFVHPLSLTDTEYLHDALLGVDEAGVIAFVDNGPVSADEVEGRLGERGWAEAQVVRLGKGEFVMPGCVLASCMSKATPGRVSLTSPLLPLLRPLARQLDRHSHARTAIREPRVRPGIRIARLAAADHVPNGG